MGEEFEGDPILQSDFPTSFLNGCRRQNWDFDEFLVLITAIWKIKIGSPLNFYYLCEYGTDFKKFYMILK